MSLTSDLPQQRISLGDITLNVIDAGGGTETVLLLHGWPDRAVMWRHQIDSLVAEGYRVIAPDLRGYGDSDKPSTVDEYSLPLAVNDLVLLLDHLGVESVSLAGHDWGAVVGWAFAAFVPERVKRFAAFSVGHPGSFASAGFPQKQLSWYMLWFQFDGVAESVMPENDWEWFRSWIHAGTPRGEDVDLDRQLSDLERPGALTASLNWFRANLPPSGFTRSVAPVELPPITCPVMGVWSDGDTSMGETQMMRSEQFVKGSWRYERLDGVDHWIPVHARDRATALLSDFFRTSSN